MEKENKSISIGAKVLGHDQVKLIVPTYDYIITQIEEIRKEAENADKNLENKKQYNNTIGLFGQRGTGKTSTLYTLINDLTIKNQDIVLDIIEPDTYGEHTKIIGAILKLLQDEVAKIEKSVKKLDYEENYKVSGFFKDCRYVKNNELKRCWNELLEYYCYKEDEYRKLLIQSYRDMESFTNKYASILSPDYEFTRKLREFINKLIDCKREIINKNKENSVGEPLLFVIIDDIDLKTTKCKELVDSVMQYMSHPNIVCILSGDYEILQESVTMALLDNEGIVKSNLDKGEIKKIFNGDNMDLVARKKYLAQEYLKKILPPAFRHNVVKWTTNNIPKFCFSFGEDDNGEKTKIYLYEKLNDLLGEHSLFNYKIKGKEIYHPSSSYEVFDTTPRGLINVLYYLVKYNEDDFKGIDKKENKFRYIKELVDTIVDSNSTLVNYKKEFFDKVLVWGADISNSKLEFKELCTMYNENKEEKDKEEEYKKIIKEFYILSLVKDFCEKNELNIDNDDEYEECKERLLFLLNKNHGTDSGEPSKFSIYLPYLTFESKFKNSLWELTNNLDFNSCNFFINYLGESMKRNPKYDEKDFYNDLCKVMEEENYAIDLLSKWININFDNEDKPMGNTINFLNEYSMIDDEIFKVEKLYEKIIDSSKYHLGYKKDGDETTIGYRNFKFTDAMNSYIYRKKDDIYDEYLKFVLCNNFGEIISNNVSNYENKTENNSLYNSLNKLIKNKEKIKNKNILIKQVEKKYERFCNKLVEDITSTLISNNIYVYLRNKNKIEKWIMELEKKDARTLANKAGKGIRQICFDKLIRPGEYKICLDDYVILIRILNYIIYESRTYIGVNECLEIKKEITNNWILIDGNTEDDLKNNILSKDGRVLKAYYEYKKIYDKEIFEIESLQEKRERMRELLKKAFNKVSEDMSNELDKIDMTLEDLEEGNDNE